MSTLPFVTGINRRGRISWTYRWTGTRGMKCKQQTQPTYDARPGNQKRPYWWEASAFTIGPLLFPFKAILNTLHMQDTLLSPVLLFVCLEKLGFQFKKKKTKDRIQMQSLRTWTFCIYCRALQAIKVEKEFEEIVDHWLENDWSFIFI